MIFRFFAVAKNLYLLYNFCMTFLQSIALGALQGIAEFLPISSSGHLAVAQAIFKLEDVPILYDIFLHIATLAAVIIFFRKKIATLFCVLFRWIARRNINEMQRTEEEANRKMIIAVIIATIVTGAIGVVTSKFIEDVPVKIVCAGFCVTGILLIASAMYESHLAKNTQKQEQAQTRPLKWWQAIIIGAAQGIGTLPGISRSGSTIAGALFCGVARDVAADFSFIVSIPAVLGAFVLELRHLEEVSGNIGAALLAAGCVTSFVTGYAALAFLMKLIKRGKIALFACYLIPLGILGIIFFR